MEKNNQDNGEEFTFVQEKVKSRWKKRLKRTVVYVAITLVLAVIFGLTARFVFIKSEGMFYSILGIDPSKQNSQRGEITFPAATDTPTPTPTPVPKPTDSEVNKPTPTPVPATPTLSPIVTEPVEKPTDTPTGSALEEYARIMNEMRSISQTAWESLVTVETVTTGVNWLDEGIEITEKVTGVIMGENNVELLVLVCYDKVKSVDRIDIRLSSSLILEATIYNYDSDCNLAVLSVPLESIPEHLREGMKAMELGESSLLYGGMPVIALGSPNGYHGSVEYGFVTAVGGYAYVTDGKVDLFYTDMSNSEDSDGIIVDLEGRLVGIITHTLDSQSEVNSSTAVSVNSIKKLILSLLNNTDRVYFGIRSEDIPADVLGRMELTNGIYVNEVAEDSPAAAAGIRKGDVITGVNDDIVRSVAGFNVILSGHNVGDVLTIHVHRSSSSDNMDIELRVTLRKKV